MAREMPQVSTSTYTASTIPIGAIIGGGGGGLSGGMGGGYPIYDNATPTEWHEFQGEWKRQKQFDAQQNLLNVVNAISKDLEQHMGRRIVQVFIADTDENVPLDKSVLYTGTQKLTDATDQELFFEIEIKSILDKHNEYRATLINKKVKERTENLEPIKIRDLRMVVVNVAEFK